MKQTGKTKWIVGIASCCVLCFQAPVYAQAVPPEEMSAGGLLSEATHLLGNNRFSLAIPYLTEYLKRMEVLDDSGVKGMMQEVRLKLAKIYAYLENSSRTVDYLNEYLDTLPLYKPREAYQLLALHLYETGEYEKCIAAVITALSNPLPQGLKEEKKEVNYEEMSKDERGGFSKRQLERMAKAEEEALAEREEDDLAAGLSDRRPREEAEFTLQDLLLLNITMGQAYSALATQYSEADDVVSAQGEWEQSLPPYQFVIDNSTDEERKGFAIMQTVTALIGLERYLEAGEFVSELYRSNARYDIRVNMALISAASALFNAGTEDSSLYDSALKLYRMVLPREEIVAYNEKKMNDIRRLTGLPDVLITITTNDMGTVQTVFGNRRVQFSEQRDPASVGNQLPVKPMELVRLEESVSSLVALPPYEDDVLYRIAQLYATAGRPWEAVATFNEVTRRDPQSAHGERAFADSLMVLLDPLEEYERIEQLATDYLIGHAEGLGPRQVAHALCVSYQRQNKWKDVKQLQATLDQFIFPEDSDPEVNSAIVKYDCELAYLQAVADMMLLNYPAAKDGFAGVMEKYPGSHQQESCTYWHAMCGIYMQDYEGALAEFTAYADVYPDGVWIASATFQRGICLFSMERYDESRTWFTAVIDHYPDSQAYPDACSMRGDLLASEGDFENAQRDYEEAIAKARNARQCTYPVFQMTAMFELDNIDRTDEIIAVVNAYLDRYGDEADIAKAAYWIGKTKLAQGKVDDAVDTYLSTILKYGSDVQQAGVDLIISDLADVYRKNLTDTRRLTLEQSLQSALAEADSETLRLRLRVLLAGIKGNSLELGRELVSEVDDLTLAPPPVLSLICDASFEAEDYSRAEEILTVFRARYEESEYMSAVLKLRCFDLFSTGFYGMALKMADEAQALYGATREMAWAQIMKARAQLELGQIAEARESLSTVLAVREWRGEPYAEATYYLGELEEAAGDLTKAFAWYQRAYMQYKGYTEGYWAAEGYLASARCLEKLGRSNDRLNTYRAMLFDRYVNKLPQADRAREVLGPAAAEEISQKVAGGAGTNIVISVEADKAQEPAAETAPQAQETVE
jgi:TolA-binding protein